MSSLARVLHQLSYATTCSVLAMNLKRRETRVLCTLPTIRPSHNGMLLSDRRIAINDSNQKLRILDAKGATMLALPIPGNWLRGLVEVDPNRLLVGVGPCGVAEVNLETQRVVKQLPLSENPNESVHGLEVAPHGG